MKAIAEEAGVSIMTVSRVLSGKGKASAATAKRVRKIAERLQYRPNRLVRGIQSGRSGLVGVVMPSGLGFYSGVLEGIHDFLAGHNANMVLSLVHGDWGEHSVEEERKILHRLVELRVDGIILRPANDEATPIYFEEILQRRLPIVVVDRRLPNFSCDFVGTDNNAGGRTAGEKLIARGAKNLLLVTAGDRFSPSRERAEGFCNILSEIAPIRTVRILECPDFAPNDDLAARFLTSREGRKTDGIFAVSDHLALGCLRALRKLNRRVPEDVSLIGFGAIGTGNGYFIPVSTFDQHPAVIGKTAAELLLNRLDRSPAAKPQRRRKTVLIPSTFVDRGT